MYSRTCPKCNNNIQHSDYTTYWKAKKKNQKCKKCADFEKSNVFKMQNSMTIDRIKECHDSGLSIKQIATQTDITAWSVGKILKHLNLAPHRLPPKKLQLFNDGTARCSRCNVIKDQEQFRKPNQGKYPNQLLSFCKDCRYKQKNSWINGNIAILLRDRCKRLEKIWHSKKPFSITPEYLKELWDKQQGKCFYTDIELKLQRGVGRTNNSMSVDRIVPENGYAPGNIVLCCDLANRVKNNLTLDQLKQWIPSWYQRIQYKYAEDNN